MSAEFDRNQQKEALKKSNTLLKTFLSPVKIKNPDAWLGELESLGDPIAGEIEDNVATETSSWVDFSVDILLIGASHFQVFNKDLHPAVLHSVSRTLFLIGHELSTDANFFVGDTMVQLQKIKMIHPQVASDSWMKSKTAAIIKTFFDAGAYVREYYHRSIEEEVDSDSPHVADFIKDFINQLNSPEP